MLELLSLHPDTALSNAIGNRLVPVTSMVETLGTVLKLDTGMHRGYACKTGKI